MDNYLGTRDQQASPPVSASPRPYVSASSPISPSPRPRVPASPRPLARLTLVTLAAGAACVIPWWVIDFIQPRPHWVLIGIAEAALGLKPVTPVFALQVLWVNGAIFLSELGAAGLLAYFLSGGRLAAGWGWGVAVGGASILLALVEPLFWSVVPSLPDRPRYDSPEAPPAVNLLRDLMVFSHLLAMVLLPQLGGLLGALAARRRPRALTQAPPGTPAAPGGTPRASPWEASGRTGE